MTGGAARRLVVFDCDSTLTRIEGVDELARRLGAGREIAALTAAAMEGHVALEDVYARRLERLRPDQASVQWLGDRYIEEQVAGARETILALHAAGFEVRIVSGGFRPAVEKLAAALGIPAAQVHAVGLQFAPDGSYVGYEVSSPLARAGGKRAVCAELGAGYTRLIAIGDGVTDLEMQEAGAEFIGFGGVVAREAVRSRAARFVDAADLRAILPLLGV